MGAHEKQHAREAGVAVVQLVPDLGLKGRSMEEGEEEVVVLEIEIY